MAFLLSLRRRDAIWTIGSVFSMSILSISGCRLCVNKNVEIVDSMKNDAEFWLPRLQAFSDYCISQLRSCSIFASSVSQRGVRCLLSSVH